MKWPKPATPAIVEPPLDELLLDTVPLMEGLHALLSPAREGLYAERLQAPGVQLKCLPL